MECPACGASVTSAAQQIENLRRLAARREQYGGLLLGEDVLAFRRRYGLTQRAAASLFGKGPLEFSRYGNETIYPDDVTTMLLSLAIEKPDVVRWLAERTGAAVPLLNPPREAATTSAQRVDPSGRRRVEQARCYVDPRHAWMCATMRHPVLAAAAMNELIIPDAAQRDESSVEMIRVWIAERGLHTSMKVGMYDDQPGIHEVCAWGRILADVAQHVADALATSQGMDRDVAIEAIKAAFNEELQAPSSGRSGGFVVRH